MNADCQTIIFSDKAYNAIITETFKKDPYETGGILLGHILDNGIWIVMEVLPPGWRSVFEYAYFEYDQEFVNYVAENESKKYDLELQLLGLWHRHPGTMDTFSGTDDVTNLTFAGLQRKGAISGIVNIDPRLRLTMYHVSNPLIYNKIDFEVGDDLIPNEYFKLKYFNETRTLNPLPKEKKNSRTTEMVSDYESSKQYQTQTIERFTLKNLNSRHLFLLLFFLTAVFALFYTYGYYSLKSRIEQQQFQKIFENKSQKIKNNQQSSNFNLININNIKVINTNVIGTADTAIKSSDNSATKVNNSNTQNKLTATDPVEGGTQKETALKNTNGKSKATHSEKTTENGIPKLLILLAITSILSLVLVFFPRNFKPKIEWIILCSAAVISSFGAIDDFFSPAFIIRMLFGFVLLSFLGILGLLVLRKFWQKQNHSIKPAKKGHWFQKDPELYLKEENDIKQNFTNIEKTVENGIVSFLIHKYMTSTSKEVTIQLVYSVDYHKNREIKIYLIEPDLDQLDMNNTDHNNITAIDGAGESYLNFSGLMPKNEVCGLTVIGKFDDWLVQNITQTR